MNDYISEAEAFSLNYDDFGVYEENDDIWGTKEVYSSIYTGRDGKGVKQGYRNPRKGRKFVDNSKRFRCMVKGCNPKLFGEEAAQSHREEYGHKVYKWPERSTEGKRRAAERNRTGYYDKYNVGVKSPRYF